MGAGAQGPRGDPGRQGIQGVPGKDGKDGKHGAMSEPDVKKILHDLSAKHSLWCADGEVCKLPSQSTGIDVINKDVKNVNNIQLQGNIQAGQYIATKGHLKAKNYVDTDGHLRVAKHADIYGNLNSKAHTYLDKGATVKGDLHTKGRIVASKNIDLKDNTYVYNGKVIRFLGGASADKNDSTIRNTDNASWGGRALYIKGTRNCNNCNRKVIIYGDVEIKGKITQHGKEVVKYGDNLNMCHHSGRGCIQAGNAWDARTSSNPKGDWEKFKLSKR